jgi:hypothetical protein
MTRKTYIIIFQKNPKIGRKRLWGHGWIGGLLVGSAKEVGLGF